MTLKACFDRLDTWTPTGITSLGLDDWPGIVAECDLPVVFPKLAGTGGESLRPLGIAAALGRLVVHVDHVLLVQGIGAGLVQQRFYNALTHIDNYLAAVVDDLTLGGNLLEPLAIADTYDGPYDIGNVIYYAVTFRHRWVIKLT